MNTNLTEIVCILDRSGSMSGLANDTIGGYNSFINQQKSLDGEATLTTVLFDDKYDLLYDHIDIKSAHNITDKEYFARGMTALLDAVGKTINLVGERLNKTPDDEKPSKVIFVITTDGYENSSTEFTHQLVRGMIEHQKSKNNWEFIFLGAGIDAISQAKSIGIACANAVGYSASTDGIDAMYKSINNATCSLRATGAMCSDWKESEN